MVCVAYELVCVAYIIRYAICVAKQMQPRNMRSVCASMRSVCASMRSVYALRSMRSVAYVAWHM